MTTKTHLIGLKEFRENTEKVIIAIGQGKSFTVLRRSKPVFTISPIDEEEGWEIVADFSKEKGGGIPAKVLLKALKKSLRQNA